MNAMLVVLGGGLGALCRFAVSALSTRYLGNGFAWGTLIVNVLGCFFIGLAAGFLERLSMPRSLWLLLVTGFLGGFTTFSTFSLETFQMLGSGSVVKALASIASNVVLGLVACGAGLATAFALVARISR
ncbi:MAG: fluoride efflux transporter CrcB [Spirochaetia bacterium]|jgi:CrcB protein|nr:fluoride efflux transporter CrcB [Spirochaetia bacterium]